MRYLDNKDFCTSYFTSNLPTDIELWIPAECDGSFQECEPCLLLQSCRHLPKRWTLDTGSKRSDPLKSSSHYEWWVVGDDSNQYYYINIFTVQVKHYKYQNYNEFSHHFIHYKIIFHCYMIHTIIHSKPYLV